MSLSISLRTVATERTRIRMGECLSAGFDRLWNEIAGSGSGRFILVDENTRKFCLPVLLRDVPELSEAEIIEITAGEGSKTLQTAENIWRKLSGSGAGRDALLINLGGGVVTDLGGFVAAGYHRGIRYVNAPTTLIGQADAAIGGKTAVNLDAGKNQVGIFYPPAAVLIDIKFLSTLPSEHLRSGLGEIIKSVILSSENGWQRLIAQEVEEMLVTSSGFNRLNRMIAAAVRYKVKLVRSDYREQGIRKALNFGHTVGHALEGYTLSEGNAPLLHGDAVVAGMICALMLSESRCNLSKEISRSVTEFLLRGFPSVRFGESDIPMIMKMMKADKKNRSGGFRFTLLEKPAKPVVNVHVSPGEAEDALLFYLEKTGQREK